MHGCGASVKTPWEPQGAVPGATTRNRSGRDDDPAMACEQASEVPVACKSTSMGSRRDSLPASYVPAGAFIRTV